jgi:hypothetical protein
MKVDRKKILWMFNYIQRINEGKPLTNEQFVDMLCTEMEWNPTCINMDEKNKNGRYYYETVGYGVMSLLGEFYRMGRIEIYDKESSDGYAIEEGTYCLPHYTATQFEDFIESIETDLPIQININSVDVCQQAVSDKLGIPVEKLNDKETVQNYIDDKIKDYVDKKNN